MKVAVLGASGWIGSQIVEEAVTRGHQVIALVRNPSAIERQDVEVRQLDVLAEQDFAQALQGVDTVIASIGGRAAGNHDMVERSAAKLLEQLPNAGVKRLLWVGGAGSLEVAPGVQLVTVPDFPAEYKDEALAQSQALQVFRNSDSPLNWTFVSPAAEIFPGEKVGQFRVGGDQLLTDAQGHSKISVADFASAMLDELETAKHAKQRISVAY
ncbi:NAD-dependent dehydratase [Vibrio navarrensis]|uniref:NAD(P)-dependent oxidoreductase n=1 Tax=Vibrio navarrensis TaxID=29495 RepID=A0AAI9CXB8_9VIBR|nr:NAD(P)-dependent oxidoreductase [Vibrio navarrensis]EJL6396685.1 NAD(P)-dependent oxidoreductase [Vibrio navarrensis]EKA5634582.1 NAD(P)-dependent oxidoreductase [Vibrio navarrensis]ELN6934154.1 NAD(P)-dependent oxidoreductase [Vibrio navarrensis]KGK21489.1 NAD-dependent dehydratase [Vibrio navarrensis]MBE3670314.1 NAD-dependent dehydratase [Vibrio navarrensis]